MGDKRALHEGSLVSCTDASYTYIDRNATFPDEFELFRGNRYIVYRLYADLWALCIIISFDPRGPIFKLDERRQDGHRVSPALCSDFGGGN